METNNNNDDSQKTIQELTELLWEVMQICRFVKAQIRKDAPKKSLPALREVIVKVNAKVGEYPDSFKWKERK